MISQEPTKNKWFYEMREDGFITCVDGHSHCPCCNEPMEVTPDGIWICVNVACPFVVNDAVQAVVTVMMENRGDDKSYDDAFLEACEIARSYTLDEVFGEEFHIHDRESAGWYVKKLAIIDAKELDIDNEVDARIMELEAEIKALNERRTEMLKPFERDKIYLTARYEPELQEWLKAELKDSKNKSIKLSYGTVGVKKTRPANVVDKDEDVLVFAEILDDPDGYQRFVNVKKSIYKEPLFAWLSEHTDDPRVRVEEDGTISLLEDDPFLPDGEEPAVIAHITPAGEEFYVKAKMPVTGVA